MSASDAGSAFFDPKLGFLPVKLAMTIRQDLAVGPGGMFYLYESGVWKPAPDEVTRRIIKRLGNRWRRGYLATVEDVLRTADLPTGHLGAPERLPVIPATQVTGDGWTPLVNLRNGVYDWKARAFEGHSPEHLSTIQLPFSHDAGAKCPEFDAWLSEVLPDDLHQLAWEVIGYLVMTGNPLQTAILLHGPAGTGKSTFLDVVEHLLGSENVSAQSLKSLTENRFAPAALFGKLANVVGDIDSAYMRDSSMFKQITGGDSMDAEEKYQKGFKFKPYAVPVFSANKVWRSADDGDGYFRRWTVLPFTRKVDRSKPFDRSKLYAETPGIFNRAMDALRDLYGRTAYDEHGNEIPNRVFEVIGSAREAQEHFAQESDPIRMWLADDPCVTTDAGNESMRTSRTILYTRYRTWCEQNGIQHPKTGPDLYAALRALGYGERKSSGTYVFLGIDVYVPASVLS